MATMTTNRRRSDKTASPCPACGSERLTDADGLPVCPDCPVPYRVDPDGRTALYRRVAASEDLRKLRAVATAARKLRELVESFDQAVYTAGSAVVEWLGDTEDTACLANGLLFAVRCFENELEIVQSQLPVGR